MSVLKKKYKRKPLVVDAVQVTPENFAAAAAWCQGRITNTNGNEVTEIDASDGKQYISVRVHNPVNPRQTKAFLGDWILYTERGYKIYTNRAFKNVFIPADDSDQAQLVVGTGGKSMNYEEWKKLIAETKPGELQHLANEGIMVVPGDEQLAEWDMTPSSEEYRKQPIYSPESAVDEPDRTEHQPSQADESSDVGTTEVEPTE